MVKTDCCPGLDTLPGDHRNEFLPPEGLSFRFPAYVPVFQLLVIYKYMPI